MTNLTPSQIEKLLDHPAPLWLRGLNLSGSDLSGADLAGLIWLRLI
jgi:uncharacterized protein YjbI with pentapeptide repeats